MAEQQLPKLNTRVRFPSPAPFFNDKECFLCVFFKRYKKRTLYFRVPIFNLRNKGAKNEKERE